jgi:hypothetical protein
LGLVAEVQQAWAEAERCYRESLAINEQLSNAMDAAMTCNQLAMVAQGAGRPAEAEGWYMRGLKLFEQADPGGTVKVNILNNLANLLLNEVQAGRAATTRLTEAQRYAEQSLAIKETLDASAEIWKTLSILARIAELEGNAEEARGHRRRERVAYAAFAGNRYHIDQQFGQIIADAAEAAKGNKQARTKAEAVLLDAEANGWHISSTIRSIWGGERDWSSLTEGMDGQQALLILRVLETIAQPAEVQGKTPEEVIASLPVIIRAAMEQGDQVALQQAFEALSLEEQKVVVEAMQYWQAQWEEEEE